MSLFKLVCIWRTGENTIEEIGDKNYLIKKMRDENKIARYSFAPFKWRVMEINDNTVFPFREH